MLKFDKKKKELILSFDKYFDKIEKYDYKSIFKLYNKINIKLQKNNFEIFFFNDLVKTYKINNKYKKIFEKIKIFSIKKNNLILDKLIKSNKYKNFLKELKLRLNNENIKCKIKDINDIYLSLLNKYKEDWIGYWSNLKIDTNGNIVEINIFDINDYNYLIKKLK